MKRFLAPWKGLDGTEEEKLTPKGSDEQAKAWDVRSDPKHEVVRVKPLEGDAPPADWKKTLADLRNGKVRVQIALVPDPIDSGMGYQFDESLDALRLGVEYSSPNMYRDRSWLPWDDRFVEEKDRAASEACRRTTPGVVLFRGPRESVAALLLVGETPTTGVHPTAMKRALEAVQQIGDAVAPIQIIGPTFSGSVTSLRQALVDWALGAKVPAPVKIITGAATGRGVVERLRERLPLPWFRDVSVDASATVAPHRALECAFLHFLVMRLRLEDPGPRVDKEGKPLPRLLENVAVLHESGTEFGATRRMPRQMAADTPGKNAADTQKETVDEHAWSCDLAAEVQLGFPFHVAAVRDAYEDMDRAHAATAEGHEDPVRRRTALEVSLRERRLPLDTQAAPSSKTTFSQDLALSHVLAEIAHEGVRYVAIQATDVADAIFLARKIRDVAPDVRLAFFDTDALLLHPAFQTDLLGSFVVGPYPFLGANDFSHRYGSNSVDPKRKAFQHRHFPLGSTQGEGTFNAALAMNGGRVGASGDGPRMLEYAFTEDGASPLPTWISVVGRTGLLPVTVQPTVDCEHTIFRDGPPSDQGPLCEALHRGGRCTGASAGDKEACKKVWDAFTRPPSSTNASSNGYADLNVDPDVTPPKMWHFVYALLVIGAFVDLLRQHIAGREMSIARPFAWGALVGLLRRRDAGKKKLIARPFAWDTLLARDSAPPDDEDQIVDVAVGRATWATHALIRTLLFAVALAYMTRVQWLAMHTYAPSEAPTLPPYAFHVGRASLVVVVGMLAWKLVLALLWLARLVGEWLRSRPRWTFGGIRGLPLRVFVLLGLAVPRDPTTSSMARLSSIRTAMLLAIVFCVTIFLGATLGESVGYVSADPLTIDQKLFVLRSLPLVNGASAAAPVLLCLACVYALTVGRMARLRLAHSVSMMSPPDELHDGACTPIRAVLFPGYPKDPKTRKDHGDGGFTAVERALLNAIWRPNTGPRYFLSVVVMLAFPVVLFVLKPPSTLDGSAVDLFAWLGLGGALIGVAMIHLVQHWIALDSLLKRIAEHPLGKSFRRVDPSVREPLDDQLSRSPSDVLRMVACANKLEGLIRLGETSKVLEKLDADAKKASSLLDVSDKLGADARKSPLADERESALRESAGADVSESQWATSALGGTAFDALGRAVLESARAIVHVLELAWQGKGFTPSAHASPEKKARGAARGRGAGKGAHASDDHASDDHASDDHASDDHASGGETDSLTPVASGFKPEVVAWLREAQGFAATVIAVLVNRHVRQFRYYLYALTVAALLLLLALVSYPFEPHRLLLTCTWVMMGSVVGSGFWIFIQLDRSPLLSAISGTKPELTLDGAFAVRVLTFGVIPLFSVAAAQYPEAAKFLFQWMEPFSRALR